MSKLSKTEEILEDGQKATVYRLTNSQGYFVEFTNIGASILKVVVNDKYGKNIDVCLGYENLSQYLTNPQYFGCALGRTAGRIRGGVFELDKEKFVLPLNNEGNTLHGGRNSLSFKVFDATFDEEKELLIFKSKLEDGEDGYPGELGVEITYSFTDTNKLIIDYAANTNKPTIVNLSNHLYLNLNGHNKDSIENHFLRLHSDFYSILDNENIPIRDVDVIDSPFDFENFTQIRTNIRDTHEQILKGKGFDHNFVINKDIDNSLELAAESFSPDSGVLVKMYTTESCFQFYTGNYLNNEIKAKDNANYDARQGFCLEAQSWPNGINNKNFKNTILRPGENYKQTTIYQFLLHT